MVLGMVIDGDGIPVCSEMWPGNTTDVTTLDQVAARLQSRFGVRRVCLVADVISKKMIAAVEARGWFYILGARLRRTKEVRDVVLSDTGAFDTVEVARQRPDMELQVKEVTVNDTPLKAPHKPRRYVVCRNRDQARKDAATREQILAALEHKLRSDGPKSVVNKGYKRYLKAEKGAFAVDLDKARDEERFDGMWVLRTNTELTAVEVAYAINNCGWSSRSSAPPRAFSTPAPSSIRPMPPSADMSSARSSRWCCARTLSSHGQRRRGCRMGRYLARSQCAD